MFDIILEKAKDHGETVNSMNDYVETAVFGKILKSSNGNTWATVFLIKLDAVVLQLN